MPSHNEKNGKLQMDFQHERELLFGLKTSRAPDRVC